VKVCFEPYAHDVSRPRALVTAPLRGPGLDRLREVADVEFDPWIEHQPIRLYSAEDLAARVAEVSADLLVCEADECKASTTLIFHTASASCSSTAGEGAFTAWGMRVRACTPPSASTATAFTEVVPMSMPTVTSTVSATAINPTLMT